MEKTPKKESPPVPDTAKEQPITVEQIRDWLDERSDFSLEMKALEHVLSLNFQAEHGGTYTDPATGLSRQFDIRCSIGKGENTVKLAVECKALTPDFPLVIQRIKRKATESYHDVLMTHASGSTEFPALDELNPSAYEVRRVQNGSKLYPVDQHTGKVCNQIGWKKNKIIGNDSQIYPKWTQAISSSYDLAESCGKDRETIGIPLLKTCIIPVLVVTEDCLLCVDYTDTGERRGDPHQEKIVDFFIGKTISLDYTLSHLRIMTLTGYKNFTRRLANIDVDWHKIFPLFE